MKNALLAAALLCVSAVHAETTLSVGDVKISNDCVDVKSGDVSVKSGDCGGKDKGSHENRSVHGDDNPGRGHDKQKKPGDRKD